MRVLLVEDEAMTAFDLTTEFELRGHVVLGPAKELEHSITLAHAERPDLALVDINLKGTSMGLQIAAALTHMLRVPVVFLTGHKPDALAHRHSAKGLIAKPIHSGRVVECAEALRLLLDGVPGAMPSDLELFDSASSRDVTHTKKAAYVLLVATDEHVRVRMTQLLERSGFSVVSVADCNTARDELKAVIYPLVIVDCGPDGGDGLELISEIRKIGGQDRAFIVTLNATGSEADMASGLTAGADDSVNKRSPDEEILESLHKVLRIMRLRPK
jgi:DNA-binding response OmpR family regulator